MVLSDTESPFGRTLMDAIEGFLGALKCFWSGILVLSDTFNGL